MLGKQVTMNSPILARCARPVSAGNNNPAAGGQMHTITSYDYLSFRPVVLRHLNSAWLGVRHLATPVNFPAKHILDTRQGKAAHGFFLVLKGLVKLSFVSYCGQEKVFFYLGEQTLFNDIPMVYGQHISTFTCATPVEALYFRREDTV